MKIKNNLTRMDLAKSLSQKKGFSILFSKKIIDNLIQILISNIKQETFLLKNIGTFKVLKKKKERVEILKLVKFIQFIPGNL